MHQTNDIKTVFEKKAGIALIVFSSLLLFTVVLHPAGGNVPGLIKMATMIIIVHSVAIISIPVGWIGFWGLTRRIGTGNFGSVLAFSFISVALIGAMIAAAVNGLVLPLYLQRYANAGDEVLNSLQPVLRYGFTINKAFDYIYTGAFCIGILCWSAAILKSGRMKKWIGWTGLVLSVLMLIVFFGGMMAANSLSGLRVFLTGTVVWIFIAGLNLVGKNKHPQSS